MGAFSMLQDLSIRSPIPLPSKTAHQLRLNRHLHPIIGCLLDGKHARTKKAVCTMWTMLIARHSGNDQLHLQPEKKRVSPRNRSSIATAFLSTFNSNPCARADRYLIYWGRLLAIGPALGHRL